MLRRYLSPLLVVVIFMAMGAHSLQVSHYHPGSNTDNHTMHEHAALDGAASQASGGESLGEQMHAAEEKKFFALLAALMAGAFMLCPALVTPRRCLMRKTRSALVRTHNYLALLFSRGILHSKVH